ncbi:hypothetical protein [Intrasporangium sp.]|nr:hypothetical protein [Intrasporangium sp.]
MRVPVSADEVREAAARPAPLMDHGSIDQPMAAQGGTVEPDRLAT